MFAQPAAPLKPIDQARVNEIVNFLPDTPRGLGEPYSNRNHWNRLLKTGKYDKFLRGMKNYTFPEFSEDDYFSLSNGTAPNSSRGLNMMRNRAKGLAKFTWAECLENKGKYVKTIEDGLRDMVRQKSWVSPRNDKDFRNFFGKEYTVELTTALYAHTIAQALYLLDDKITPELRREAIDAVYKRAFEPTLKTINTQDVNTQNRYLTTTNNYNPVCLSGVVGAALALIPEKKERAEFVHIGEYYSLNALAGFNEDGYCTEGVTYFNYGFGNYILLRECILQATQQKVDLFAHPKLANIVRYPSGIRIINDMYPAFSDCAITGKPEKGIVYYLSKNLQLGLSEYDRLKFEGGTDNLMMNIMLVFPNSASETPQTDKPKLPDDYDFRSFFEQTVLLTERPGKNTGLNMGVAIKGGNNKEHHNHNDVGSYNIVVGKSVMAGDPGSMPYTANIFTAKYRYTYKKVGSYGHPVPLVAGKQQKPGDGTQAILVRKNFSDEQDELTMDIRPAYDVAELTKLERTSVYSRTRNGSFRITDAFAATKPIAFETAIITCEKWTKQDERTLVIESDTETLKVAVAASQPFVFKPEEIKNEGKPYFRIAVAFKGEAANGEISMTFTTE
jgi:hypothetical protein